MASSSFVFLDVISVVKRDARSVGILASLVIFLILLIDLRSVLGALVCFGTLGGAILWTLALMRLTGVNIGVYNLLVLPTLMGIGIDASVYLWHRWKQVGARRLRYLMSSTGMSVIMALVTTAAGLIIVFSFVLLPAFFVLNSKKGPAASPGRHEAAAATGCSAGSPDSEHRWNTQVAQGRCPGYVAALHCF